MAAIIVAWFPTIPSLEIARGPIIIAVPTFIIPRAVFVPTASATTIIMIIVTRIAGIIRAWVIEAFA